MHESWRACPQVVGATIYQVGNTSDWAAFDLTPLYSGLAMHLRGGSYPRGGWLDDGSGVGATDAIAGGQQASFRAQLRAPSAAGSYPFQWRMVKDGVAWFGSATPNRVITVY